MRHLGLAFLMVGLMACAAPTAAPTRPSDAGKPADTTAASREADFQKLVQAANREGKVVLWTTTPSEANLPKVEQAFNDRFKTNIKLEVVPVRAVDATPRWITEAQAGRHEIDVMASTDTGSVLSLSERGLLADIDWAALFGDVLPDIRGAADLPFPELKGQILDFWHSSYAFVYNTGQVRREDVPKRWADLADPRYRGQFVFDGLGFPFNWLSMHPDWGTEKTEKLVRDIAGTRPLLQNGSAVITQAVARGEGSMGVASVPNILRQKKLGAPVDMVIPDYVPYDYRLTVLAAKAPNPNAARLYAAWSSTEGMQLFGELEDIYRLTQPNTPIEKIMKDQAPNAKLVAVRNLAQIKESSSLQREIGETLTGIR